MCRTDLSSDADALSQPLLEISRQPETASTSNPTEKRSRNISLILAYTFFAFAGRALWNQSVLSTYIYLLRNNNPEAVGFMTAVMGLSQLMASVPAGIFADKHRRDVALKVASVVGMAAIVLTLLSLIHGSYILVTIALAVWGLLWGIANTCLAALFADSIQDGDRSHYFTKRSILIKLGNTTGPLAALVLFAVLGDEWTLHDCAIVMAVGQIVSLPGVILLCFPSDNDVVATSEPAESLSESLMLRYSFDDNRDSDFSDVEDDNGREAIRSPLQSEVNFSFHSDTPETAFGCISEKRVIPIFVSLADVLSGLASGMSIRYFPIFFLDNLHLSPVTVQVLFLLSPLTGTVLAHVGQACSLRNGRCFMTCIYKWIGISCMFLMIFSYKCKAPVWLVCILYLLRTSFMNSTTALTKSVLMDAVPKNERGKWSALESVNMFSWSGSAALGGVLVGMEGILFNFCVTGSLQLLATAPLVLLFSRENMEVETRIQSASSTTSHAEEEETSRPHFLNDSRFKL